MRIPSVATEKSRKFHKRRLLRAVAMQKSAGKVVRLAVDKQSRTYLIKKYSVSIQVMIDFAVLGIAMIQSLRNVMCNP